MGVGDNLGVATPETSVFAENPWLSWPGFSLQSFAP